MTKYKLTKTYVDSLSYEEKGQKFYWDTKLSGFGLCVGKKTKSYIAQRDINGRSVRSKIGTHTLLSTDKARQIARTELLKMSQGTNPNKEKKKKKLSSLTLKDLCNEYIETKQGKLKQGTIEGYQSFMNCHFQNWARKDFKEIDRTMIIKKHKKITNEAGPYAANNAMVFLKMLYNFAAIDNEGLINPVKILSQKKLLNKKERRKNSLTDHQIPRWFNAVLLIQNDSFRDVLLLILFTGLRKMEAFSLKWENVNFDERSFSIPDTKNNMPLTLPMSNFIFSLLEKRQIKRQSDEWVFPGRGTNNHIIDARRSIKSVAEKTNIKFMLHDLRRTFITTANDLSISHVTIKKLVNHSVSGDVTAGYVVMSLDKLRAPNQKIANRFLELIEAPQVNS